MFLDEPCISVADASPKENFVESQVSKYVSFPIFNKQKILNTVIILSYMLLAEP